MKEQETKGSEVNYGPTRWGHSGAFDDELISAAIRRQVAWITLAQRQREHTGDDERADLEIREAVETLMTLSLEVAELENRLKVSTASS